MLTIINKPISITIIIILTLFIGSSIVERKLDEVFNYPSGETHSEIFLWKAFGYPKQPMLDFYLDIYTEPQKIRVVYKIENTSDRPVDIENQIDLAVVASDAPVGDPGTLVWRWTKKRGKSNFEKISLAPGKLFKAEIFINRKEAQANAQFYINAYYKGELVSQYKIIEGIIK